MTDTTDVPRLADARTVADLPDGIRAELLEGEPTPALQLLPPLAERDLEELRSSVRERGIRVPVELDARGRILDGHHRLQVARELELPAGEIPVAVREDLEGEEATLEYVLELNLGRRHLTPEDRRKVAGELRRRGWSLRRIADRVGVHHETIRRDLEGAGVANATGAADGDDLPEEVQGADGKRYPARRSTHPEEVAERAQDSARATSSSGRPGHAQGRDLPPDRSAASDPGGSFGRDRGGGSPAPDGPTPDPGPAGEGEDGASLLEELETASAALDRAVPLAPGPQMETRLEELAEDVVDVMADVAGDGDSWVLPS